MADDDVNLEKAKAIVDGYWDRFMPLVYRVLMILPNGRRDIAVVGEKLAFVYHTTKHQASGTEFAGETEGTFCVCDEIFELGIGRKPDASKTTGQCGIDTILEAEDKPFVMIGLDQTVQDYVARITHVKREIPVGSVRGFLWKQFAFYTEQELGGKIGYALKFIKWDVYAQPAD